MKPVSHALEGGFLPTGPQGISGVAQSRTRLKRLSSSSSRTTREVPSCPLLNSFSIPCLLTLLEGCCPLQPHRLYEYEGPLSVGGCKVTIRRNVYKAAALPYAPLELKQMELSKSSSWVVNKTGMCQHKHPRACIPLFLYPHLSPNPLQGIPNRYILRLLV